MAKVFQATHVGKVRHNNEDSLIVIEPETFIVADGMGTTATILSLDGGQAHFAHVGDSRLYLLRNNFFRQMTEDHSYVETLVRRGELTAEAARFHPMKNVLTQAVGAVANISIDKSNFPVERGDKFLLCTDGLTNMVDDADIVKILQTAENPAEALIEAALSAGGKDNVSVIVAGVD